MHPFYIHTPVVSVKKDDILFFSGIDASMNRDRHHIPARSANGNLAEQTEIVYKKLQMALEAAGASFDNLCRIHTFIAASAVDQLAAYKEVKESFIGKGKVAEIEVIMTRNLNENALIMIDPIATLGPKEVIKISDAWPEADAVKSGDWVFTAGIGPYDPKTGQLVGPGDVIAQTKQVFENQEAVMIKAGTSYRDVVRTVDWIDKRGLGRQYAQTGPVRKAFHRDAHVCSTGMIINRHLNTDLLITVDITCYLAGERQSLSFNHPRYNNLIYREGLKHGPVITLSGNCAIDYTSRDILYTGDLGMQTRHTLYNQQAGLRLGGADYNDVVKMVEYITPDAWDQAEAARKEFQEFTRQVPFAWTRVCCEQLLMAGEHTEIDVIAIQGPVKQVWAVNTESVEPPKPKKK